VAGHSLGEYNALYAAGAFDFVTGVELVKKRGALMAESREGGMAAVIGLPLAQIEELCEEQLGGSVDIANLNASLQTVISGPTEDVLALVPILEEAGAARVLPLKVSAAFHSRYMQEVADAFDRFLSRYRFSWLRMEVLSNVSGKPYGDSSIAENLVAQITHRVRWIETVRYLLRQPSPTFEEVGPGRVLTALIQQIRIHDEKTEGHAPSPESKE